MNRCVREVQRSNRSHWVVGSEKGLTRKNGCLNWALKAGKGLKRPRRRQERVPRQKGVCNVSLEVGGKRVICGIHDISENGSDRILMELRNVASAGFLGGSVVRNGLPVQEMQGRRVQFSDWEDALDEEMATHSNSLAWESPWTGEPGGPQSMRSQRAGHDWVCTREEYQHSNSIQMGHWVAVTLEVGKSADRLIWESWQKGMET